MKDTVLYIVVPCYNEEKVLQISTKMFSDKIDELINKEMISERSKVLFVNDGSTDNTWNLIKKLSEDNHRVIGITLSRNRGHQNAVYAGLMEAMDKCDVTVSIDCDGQDDINAINEMIVEYDKGNEIVYGVRNSRETDSFFKRFTAESFYKLMKFLGVESIYNHADYRLISAKVLRYFSEFKEVNLYLRGMIPLVGFKSSCVYYSRSERIAGESHYPLSKMLSLAIDGITSLSIKPIKLISGAGIVSSILGLVLLIIAIIKDCTSIIAPIGLYVFSAAALFGGIQLVAIGVIGEYIGRTYLETKARPKYIISERTYSDDKE